MPGEPIRFGGSGVGSGSGWCSRCDESRSLAELIVVTDRLSGHRFYVCRPSVHTSCFRLAVRGAGLQTIAAADRSVA